MFGPLAGDVHQRSKNDRRLTVRHQRYHNDAMKSSALSSVVLCFLLLQGRSVAGEKLPEEQLLWKQHAAEHLIRYEIDEQVRSPLPPPGSPSGSNRVFSYVSEASYSIHHPEEPNGVGLVICPGGGYRDVWLDREGHDLALWLKTFGVTSLVLKYRTNSGKDDDHRAYAWNDYLPAVQADARQAIRILRTEAPKLGLQTNKIGICGFSAGGNLALLATLYTEPKQTAPLVSGMPDFAGLFYPWFRDDYRQQIKSRSAPESATRDICPVFIMNASDDQVTPATKCVDFYTALLKAGVNAELHVFSKGSHGFDLATGRAASAAIWPNSFVAWLRDANIIEGD